MICPQRDPDRWRRRYALRPRRIGEHWVWLEWFAWRPMSNKEIPPAMLRDMTLWREYNLKRIGYTVWREEVIPVSVGPSIHVWHRPQPQVLRVVSS